MARTRQEPDFDPIPIDKLDQAILYIFAKLLERSKDLRGNASQIYRAFYAAHLQFPNIFDKLLFYNQSGAPYSKVLSRIIFRMKIAGLLLILQEGTCDKLYMRQRDIIRFARRYSEVSYFPDGLIDFLIQELEITK